LIIQRHLVKGSISAGSVGFQTGLTLILELGQLLQGLAVERVVEIERIRMGRIKINDDFLRLVRVELGT
jgi:hypothetical protein